MPAFHCRLSTEELRRQWSSMDISHNLLWAAMAMDRRIARRPARWLGTVHHILGSTMASYRSAVSPVYCRRQHILVDSPPSSIVEAIDQCCAYFPGCEGLVVAANNKKRNMKSIFPFPLDHVSEQNDHCAHINSTGGTQLTAMTIYTYATYINTSTCTSHGRS